MRLGWNGEYRLSKGLLVSEYPGAPRWCRFGSPLPRRSAGEHRTWTAHVRAHDASNSGNRRWMGLYRRRRTCSNRLSGRKHPRRLRLRPYAWNFGSRGASGGNRRRMEKGRVVRPPTEDFRKASYCSHSRSALYTTTTIDARSIGQKQFDYVDPRNRDYQIEMEKVATGYHKADRRVAAAEIRNGSSLHRRHFRSKPASSFRFAIVSGPSSTRSASARPACRFRIQCDSRRQSIRPTTRRNSCAGSAIRVSYTSFRSATTWESGDAGMRQFTRRTARRYAVQLDSDDLYLNEAVLRRVVNEFDAGPYAMVIGSYTMVDFSLKGDSTRSNRSPRVESRKRP